MAILEALIGPLTAIIDKVIPDKDAREKAKFELIKLQGTQEMEMIEARLSASRSVKITIVFGAQHEATRRKSAAGARPSDA